jgi:hypothetical protein
MDSFWINHDLWSMNTITNTGGLENLNLIDQTLGDEFIL